MAKGKEGKGKRNKIPQAPTGSGGKGKGKSSPALTVSGGKWANKGSETSPAPTGSGGGEGPSQGSNTFPASTVSGGDHRWKVIQANEEAQELQKQYREMAPGNFDGGRATVLIPHRCDQCKRDFAVASCLVMCTRDGKVPYMQSHRVSELKARMLEAVSGAPPPPFINLMDT